MDTRKIITFFRRYALLVFVLASITACSAVYAGIYVNDVLGGELGNATVSVSFTVSVPTAYVAQAPTMAYGYVVSVPTAEKLSFPVAYSCALVVNASGVLSTVPCFTTTTSSSTTSTTTTASNTTTTTVAGGGAVGGGGAPATSSTTVTLVTPVTTVATPTHNLPPLMPPQGLPPAANVGLGIIVLSVASAALYSEIRKRRRIPTLFRARYRYKPVRWGKRVKKWWEE